MIRKSPIARKPAAPKLHTCKNKACGEKFVRQRMGQQGCCTGCCIVLGKDKTRADMEKAAKIDRKETAAKKLAIKPRAKWLAEAQAACNQFIRARDAHLPCISCGNTREKSKYNAGHYLSVGAMPTLRFSEENIHKQCEHCNSYLSGNIAAYRPQLIAKIGLDRVEWLEGPHEAAKHTIDDLKAIKATYKAKLKALQAENTEEGI